MELEIQLNYQQCRNGCLDVNGKTLTDDEELDTVAVVDGFLEFFQTFLNTNKKN
ncbi:hypothetical protein [Lacrimispora defluvii]|uniref:Uncharacterized protein n=1 Tax=Lacrimispora defluvii TaxID=2719233 RepID=A0ABX1VKJ7_9FIRM|nr:hypothetical protein [Lacrimispora defluvii]NNJ28842.1 hypothetical protein [Lacrimispora defluvii]